MINWRNLGGLCGSTQTSMKCLAIFHEFLYDIHNFVVLATNEMWNPHLEGGNLCRRLRIQRRAWYKYYYTRDVTVDDEERRRGDSLKNVVDYPVTCVVNEINEILIYLNCKGNSSV